MEDRGCERKGDQYPLVQASSLIGSAWPHQQSRALLGKVRWDVLDQWYLVGREGQAGIAIAQVAGTHELKFRSNEDRRQWSGL